MNEISSAKQLESGYYWAYPPDGNEDSEIVEVRKYGDNILLLRFGIGMAYFQSEYAGWKFRGPLTSEASQQGVPISIQSQDEI